MEIKVDNIFTVLFYQNSKEKQTLEKLQKEKLTLRRQVYNPFKKSYEEEITQLLVEIPEKKCYYMLTGFLPFIGIDYPKNHLELIDLQQLYQDEMWTILRDYQKEAIQTILQEPRGIFEAVTGAGKTMIMIAICKAIKEDKLILVIVPKSQALLEQTIKAFLKFFPLNRIGWNYGKGYREGRIMISSPGCLIKLPLEYYHAVLIDECHSIPSKTISEALYKMKNTVIRYGFSGTPIGRSDKRDFLTIGLLGQIFDYKVTYADLEKIGFIAPCKYIMINFNSLKLLDKNLEGDVYDIKLNDMIEKERFSLTSLISAEFNEWHDIIEYYAVKNKTRNYLVANLINLLVNKYKRNCLIIVERIQHGEILLQLLKQNLHSLSIDFIYSQRKDISNVLEKFRNNQINVLIATQLIEFGIDIPNLNSIILASIGKSSIQLLQRIGRGLRPKQGETLFVFDFCDKGNRLLQHHAFLRKKWISDKNIPIHELKLTDIHSFLPSVKELIEVNLLSQKEN